MGLVAVQLIKGKKWQRMGLVAVQLIKVKNNKDGSSCSTINQRLTI